MPRRREPKVRVCAVDGCPEQSTSTYCPEHRRQQPRKPRSPSSYVTSTTEWKRIRPAILQRDSYTCHYCGGKASTVDHFVPVTEGGAELDPANLVAACWSCNARKGGKAAAAMNR